MWARFLLWASASDVATITVLQKQLMPICNYLLITTRIDSTYRGASTTVLMCTRNRMTIEELRSHLLDHLRTPFLVSNLKGATTSTIRWLKSVQRLRFEHGKPVRVHRSWNKPHRNNKEPVCECRMETSTATSLGIQDSVKALAKACTAWIQNLMPTKSGRQPSAVGAVTSQQP